MNTRKPVKFAYVLKEVGATALLSAGLALILFLIDRSFNLSLASTFLIGLAMVIVPLASFSVLEFFVTPAGPRRTLENWFLHLKLNIFISSAATVTHTVLISTLVAVVGKHFGIGLIDLRLMQGSELAPHGIAIIMGALIVSLFVGDFFFYWYHRIQHKGPFLWQIHKVHHTDRTVDVLTDGRHSVLDQLPRTLFIFLPMAILFQVDDVDPLKVGLVSGILVGTINAFLRCVLHFNAKWHWGFLTPVICGPQVHRIHHSIEYHHMHRNFAGVFPLWDMLFGTYYAPARDEYPATGVYEDPDFGSLYESQAATVRGWRDMLKAGKGEREVIAVEANNIGE